MIACAKFCQCDVVSILSSVHLIIFWKCSILSAQDERKISEEYFIKLMDTQYNGNVLLWIYFVHLLLQFGTDNFQFNFQQKQQPIWVNKLISSIYWQWWWRVKFRKNKKWCYVPPTLYFAICILWPTFARMETMFLIKTSNTIMGCLQVMS